MPGINKRIYLRGQGGSGYNARGGSKVGRQCSVMCKCPVQRAKSWCWALAGDRLRNCFLGWKCSLWLSQRDDRGRPVSLLPSGVLPTCQQPSLFPRSSDSWVVGSMHPSRKPPSCFCWAGFFYGPASEISPGQALTSPRVLGKMEGKGCCKHQIWEVGQSWHFTLISTLCSGYETPTRRLALAARLTKWLWLEVTLWIWKRLLVSVGSYADGTLYTLF